MLSMVGPASPTSQVSASAHFANRQDVMAWQTSVNEIGGFAVDSTVEVASLNPRQVNQVAAEFQQQSF
jgi:hypothetical protein